MPVFIGGAELNVALALANWQVPVSYGTALPQNALADDVLTYIQQRGIDTAAIARTGQRLGSYYLPQGSDLQNGGVIYDRAHSAFSTLTIDEMDLDALFADVGWLHVSAISPALTVTAAELCQELVVAASGRGITVSIDLNHRSSLWQYGVSPVDVMPGIVHYCDVVMGNVWSANALLGTPVDERIHDTGQKTDYVAHAQATSDALMSRFPRCKAVAQTFRFDEPTGLRYFATLNTAGQQDVSPTHQVASVVSRVGSGDCFMAGLIYGFTQALAPQAIIDFATQAAIGKLQEAGDATRQSVPDIARQLSLSSTYC